MKKLSQQPESLTATDLNRVFMVTEQPPRLGFWLGLGLLVVRPMPCLY